MEPSESAGISPQRSSSSLCGSRSGGIELLQQLRIVIVVMHHGELDLGALKQIGRFIQDEPSDLYDCLERFIGDKMPHLALETTRARIS